MHDCILSDRAIQSEPSRCSLAGASAAQSARAASGRFMLGWLVLLLLSLSARAAGDRLQRSYSEVGAWTTWQFSASLGLTLSVVALVWFMADRAGDDVERAPGDDNNDDDEHDDDNEEETNWPHGLGVALWPHAWPHGLMALWPHGLMASWPHGLMHGLMASWPQRGLVASAWPRGLGVALWPQRGLVASWPWRGLMASAWPCGLGV